MVRADNDRIGELSRYLLKSDDLDLWLNIIKNSHVLADGLTAGEAVLNKCLVQLVTGTISSETVVALNNNDCAVWFYLFRFLKVFHSHRTPLLIKALLTLEGKYKNKENVLK